MKREYVYVIWEGIHKLKKIMIQLYSIQCLHIRTDENKNVYQDQPPINIPEHKDGRETQWWCVLTNFWSWNMLTLIIWLQSAWKHCSIMKAEHKFYKSYLKYNELPCNCFLRSLRWQHTSQVWLKNMKSLSTDWKSYTYICFWFHTTNWKSDNHETSCNSFIKLGHE